MPLFFFFFFFFFFWESEKIGSFYLSIYGDIRQLDNKIKRKTYDSSPIFSPNLSFSKFSFTKLFIFIFDTET